MKRREEKGGIYRYRRRRVTGAVTAGAHGREKTTENLPDGKRADGAKPNIIKGESL